jgi:hypothetical protein
MNDNIIKAEDGGDKVVESKGSSRPLWHNTIEGLKAGEVKEHVLANAGARPWDRDEIDTRIIETARKGTGKIINSEADVGGYPQHEPTYAPFNPDDWDLNTMTRKSVVPIRPIAVRASPFRRITPELKAFNVAGRPVDMSATVDNRFIIVRARQRWRRHVVIR